MRILIGGGGGFIGTYISDHLQNNGHDVAILDTFQYKPQIHDEFTEKVRNYRISLLKNADVYEGNVCCLDNLLEIFQSFKPTHVINLASISLALGAEHNANEAVDLSTQAIKNIFLASQIFNVDRIVHFSSSYVYGNFRSPECDEQHSLSPINVYGRTKQVSEILCRTLSEAFSQRAVLIRPISVYGVGDLNGKISSTNISSWIKDKELRLNGGPDRINTLTHLNDVARALEIVLTSEEACGETFNLSSDEHLSNLDILKHFEKRGYQLKLSEPNDGILKVPVRGRLSINKIKSLGFEPRESFDKHLDEMIHFSLA